EIVARIEHRVAKIFVSCSMKCVGAALGYNVDYRARIAPVLGLEIRKHLQFCNGIQWQHRSWRTENSALVDCRQIAVTVVHIGAIEKKIVSVSTVAISTEKSIRTWRISAAIRFTRGPRHHDQHLGVIAAVNRQVDDLLVFELPSQ